MARKDATKTPAKPARGRMVILPGYQVGRDSLGDFELFIPIRTSCGICNRKGLCVRYQDKPSLGRYAAEAPGLLLRNKKTSNFIRTIGINCGCYAKVHRQIAHIQKG